jgi:hypothetical protein
MIRYWLGGTAAVVTLIGLAFAADGFLWVTKSQFTMQGIPFTPPPQSSNFCAPLVWNRPPAGGDPSCKNTNYQLVDNTATWDMACTGGRGRCSSHGAPFLGATVNRTDHVLQDPTDDVLPTP